MSHKRMWVGLLAIAMTVGVSGRSSAAPVTDPNGHGRLSSTGQQSSARPTVLIDFNELTGHGSSDFGAFDSKGYHFSSKHAHVMLRPKGCAFGGCVSNGTPYITEEAGSLGKPITMARADGGTFCLKKFDGGENFLDDQQAREGGYPNAEAILVVGVKASGGEVSQSLPLDDIKDGAGGLPDFQSFTLSPDFRGLTSVTFYGNDHQNSGAMSVDNVAVRA